MFYGQKLYEIREMFSCSRKDLAEILKLNEQLIWQFETNQVVPSFIVINQLKELFHVRSSFFLNESFIKDIAETSNIAYRKKFGEAKSGVKSEGMFLNFFFTHIQEVEKIVFPSKGAIHSLCKQNESKYNLSDLSMTDIKEIAKDTRSSLGVTTNKRLMYHLELSGVYIVERNLKEEIDAYSSWILNDGYPVIVLNKGKNPATRRNFDLAHELGHLLLHRYIDFDQLDKEELNKIEKEANVFSSYFTLPEEELKTDFFSLKDPTNPRVYIDLKRKYRMSIQSIAYRANQEGWLSKEENRLFWKKIHQYNYKISEPLDSELPVHTPGKIHALLSSAIDKHDGLVTEWLDRYSVDTEYFERIFGLSDDLLKKSVGKKERNYLFPENLLKLDDF